LDGYGAKDEVEFFAVATEHFFDQPLRMRRAAPELYRVLKNYFRQDPAARKDQYAASRKEHTRETGSAFARAPDTKKGEGE
jgi:Mlc titration factor MtfA (ptsG expression regulator)